MRISASTKTTYDASGEVTGVTDPLATSTQYAYDAAGRRTTRHRRAERTSPRFTYDAVGNQISMTDANGNTTQYQYDALNRRTQVIYPDSTFDSTAYDALGRTISQDGSGRP